MCTCTYERNRWLNNIKKWRGTSNKKIPYVMKCDIELINTKKEQEQDFEFYSLHAIPVCLVLGNNFDK